MQIGTVKFFNTDKGYGFISPDDGGRDLFAHVYQFHEGIEPCEGQRVQFDIRESARKPGRFEAANIRLAAFEFGRVV